MDAQSVDWGTLAGLLGLATLLWRMMNTQTKDMNRRFDHQDKEMAELRSDVGELKTEMAVVKGDLGHVKNDLGRLQTRCDRMDTNLVQLVRDVGRLEGEQKSPSQREKIGAGSS